MAQKDMAEKLLADYNDVFADIVNVLLFDGKEVVQENDLVDTKAKSQYKADDQKLHEQERDISKILKKDHVQIVMIGLENQTAIDPDMPLRCLAYDGAAYRSQMLGQKKERYPVVTIVLYFGSDKWSNNQKLSDTVRVPDEWKPYFNDYRAHIFQIAHLSREQVSMFKSDFRIVADYFVQKQQTGDYIGNKETIKHVDEVLKLLSVFADKRFTEEYVVCESEGKVENMCEVLDRIEKQGIERGIRQGIEQGFKEGESYGIVKGKIQILREVFHYSDEKIADELKLSIDEVRKFS